jgi:hypothetical protein
MPVGRHSFKNPVEACFGCRAVDFDAHFGNASVGLDEFFIEGRQIKLSSVSGTDCPQANEADIVLDANPKRPIWASAGATSTGQLRDLAHLFALLIAKPSACRRSVPCSNDSVGR